MTRLRPTFIFLFCVLAFSPALWAQPDPTVQVDSLHPGGEVEFQYETHTAVGTNGIVVTSAQAVLVADGGSYNWETKEAVADGHVRLQQNDDVWVGEHIRYNFQTRQIISDQKFRTGKAPVFAEARGLHGDITNHIYFATNAVVTADDVFEPAIRVRAQRITIVPGQRIEARHAVLYLGAVPVFYFPYYSRNLSPRANNFNFTPGYRGSYGPFLLASYTWFLNEQFDGALHADYREKRGPGIGPDLNVHLGRWGEGYFRYYYTHDDDPQTNAVLNAPVFENRQRVSFSYQANPYTNFNFKALVNYQSDIGVLHDFFESEYRRDPQPNTFIEANKFWNNFSLDVLTTPRLNDFFETVERLPDVRLSGFRQQLGGSPFYYESETSIGYYQRLFAETNGFTSTNFFAARADTYHQITMPETLFGWLNVVPRVGGRFTYYTDAKGPGATTSAVSRGLLNTGAEVSFKASRLWPAAHSSFLDLDGVRHIVEPSVNYVFVPEPNTGPNEVPQFDYELPSLRLLPIEYPEYNSIDSIDSQNVLRFGLRNKLQTKRRGRVDDLLNWEVFTDWRLQPRTNQQTFADLYSDLTLRPRSWLTLQSQVRFDINQENWRLLLHTVTIEPNDVWSWTLGHFYLRDDFSPSPTALGQGANVVISSLFYRLNENWGFRATHHYDARGGQLEEQFYTVYRDLRSWTVALTGGVRKNQNGRDDLTVVFTFSLKAFPRFALGSDTARAHSLLGR